MMGDHEARNANRHVLGPCELCGMPVAIAGPTLIHVTAHVECWVDAVDDGIAALELYLSAWAAFAAWESTATAFTAGAETEGGHA